MTFLQALWSLSASAGPQWVELTTSHEVDQHISELRESYPPQKFALFIQHFGDEIPANLRRAAFLLDKAGYDLVIHVAPVADLASDLKKATDDSEEAFNQIYYRWSDTDWSAEELAVLRSQHSYHVDRVVQQASRLLEKIAGIAGGLTLTMAIDRDRATKLRDAVSAVLPATVAGTAFFWGTYSQSAADSEWALLFPTLSLGAWTWYNLYESRRINKIMSQGKRLVREVSPDGRVWMRVKRNSLFFASSIFARSFLTNIALLTSDYMIRSSADPIGREDVLRMSVNSGISVLSRYGVEAFLGDHAANPASQLTERSAMRIRIATELFTNAAKYLHLVNYPVLKWFYPAMGLLTVAYVINSRVKSGTLGSVIEHPTYGLASGECVSSLILAKK